MSARVLVCDDEGAVRFTVQDALESVGYESVAAGDVEEALARLDGCDVVITDLAMPGRDGLALLAEVRARDPELPVILLTARGSERVAVQAMKLGAWDYLPKPFALDELRAAVSRAAEAIGVSQPSVSIQLAGLEQACGVLLLRWGQEALGGRRTRV